MENTKNLLCPCCDAKLVHTHDDHYQDLCEHVCDPNAKPSLKAGFQCPTEDCMAHKCNVTWIEDGDYYTGERPEGISYSDVSKALESKYGTAHAVNSWNFHYQLGKNAVKARTKDIRFLNWRLVIEPKEYGWDYPEEKRHMPRKIGWKFEWWRKDGEGYIHIIPDYRMVKHCIQKFKTNYNSVLFNADKNQHALKECMQEINCQTYGGYPETRRYAKISSWIIRTFYSGEVFVIKTIAKRYNIK